MVREIRQDFPDLTVVVLTMYHDKDMIREVDELGIAGYLLKHTDSNGILDSLRKILRGEHHIDENVVVVNNNREFGSAHQMEFHDDFQSINSLGNREKELLGLVAQGLSNQEIAETMFVSIDTIYSHRKHIKKKLVANCRKSDAATAKAYFGERTLFD